MTAKVMPDGTVRHVAAYPSVVRGGAGSGNFGHAGRPGKMGGSAPGGGSGGSVGDSTDSGSQGAAGVNAKKQDVDTVMNSSQYKKSTLDAAQQFLEGGEFDSPEDLSPGDQDAAQALASTFDSMGENKDGSQRGTGAAILAQLLVGKTGTVRGDVSDLLIGKLDRIDTMSDKSLVDASYILDEWSGHVGAWDGSAELAALVLSEIERRGVKY